MASTRSRDWEPEKGPSLVSAALLLQSKGTNKGNKKKKKSERNSETRVEGGRARRGGEIEAGGGRGGRADGAGGG